MLQLICISGWTLRDNIDILTVFQVKLDQGAQEAEAQIQFERLLQALGQERVQAWLQQASELKQA